ncbi:hypothetical protein BaRGS_00035316 [Batillaria attramentaria]|uniref:Uncharacterized protein n=1 Tax=Batillaria attramentaria TaxID=370345 RepID=A0ABD0JF30_9CAEN
MNAYFRPELSDMRRGTSCADRQLTGTEYRFNPALSAPVIHSFILEAERICHGGGGARSSDCARWLWH